MRSFPTFSLLVPRIERTGPVNTFADFVDHVPTREALMAVVAVKRYALARSNDCRESEAIVVLVNEYVGELSRGKSRLMDKSIANAPVY